MKHKSIIEAKDFFIIVMIIGINLVLRCSLMISSVAKEENYTDLIFTTYCLNVLVMFSLGKTMWNRGSAVTGWYNIFIQSSIGQAHTVNHTTHVWFILWILLSAGLPLDLITVDLVKIF